MTVLFDQIISEVHTIFGDGFVPLHRPVFEGNERQYLVDCIDSNFVSSVGTKVTEFEQRIADFAGSKYAVATRNGTAALHIALGLAGVRAGEEVITQALTFIATCNATRYCDAWPVFVDVESDTLGMSPTALRRFLEEFAERRPEGIFNRTSGRRLAACVPMHTFGLPCRITEIIAICQEYGISVVEDAAESLGSYVGEQHTGSFGTLGTFSFNGNKVITTGGGGMIVTNDEALALRAKHITTTAKVPHAWEFVHDEVGYNYRLPNLNAALGCAQMERLPEILAIKAGIAARYAALLEGSPLEMVQPLPDTTANNWLNAVLLENREARDAFLEYTNSREVMTRPVWRLMHHLEMFAHCQHDGLVNSLWLEDRLVNLPSSVPEGALGKL
ncbi:MAG: LegC family aminotransferase [Haliea sp.]